MKNLKKVLCIILISTIMMQAIGCSKKDIITENNSLSEVSKESALEENQTISLPYIERHPFEAYYDDLVRKVSKLSNGDNGEIDIRSADLSQTDLSDEYENLMLTTYDSKTIWPDNLPEGFNPDKITEICKDPGLEVRNLHKEGITGKNVGIAIIDQVLLTKHEEFTDQLKYYSENDFIKKLQPPAQMHGAAVASIAVGKTCGVAPEASLYYIADDFGAENYTSRIADDMNELLDLNKTLKEDEKIRVISISWGAEDKESDGYLNLKKAYQRANEEGVFVITTSLGNTREDIKGINFNGMNKTKLADPNDFSVYKPSWAQEMDSYMKDYLCLPMDNRCVASPTGVNDYAIYQSGGISWSVPYLAGVYALACQVKPDIDYKEFWKVALDTAVANEKLDTIINPQGIIDKLKEQK